MITLKFQTKGYTSGDYRSSIFLGMSAEVIESTCFNLPVRLRINNIDLFENLSNDRIVFVCHVEREMYEETEISDEINPWIAVPLLHLASTGLRQVRKACLGESVFYHLPGGGSLQIRPAGEWVEITSSLNQRSARVSCSELLEAFEDFSARVRRFILQEIPEIREHAAWPSWFEAKNE